MLLNVEITKGYLTIFSTLFMSQGELKNGTAFLLCGDTC